MSGEIYLFSVREAHTVWVPRVCLQTGGFWGDLWVRAATEGCVCAQGQVQLSVRGMRARRCTETRTQLLPWMDGGAGAQPQGFQLDGAVSDKPLWLHSAWLLLDHRILVALTILLHLALVKAQKESSCLGLSLQKWSIWDLPGQRSALKSPRFVRLTLHWTPFKMKNYLANIKLRLLFPEVEAKHKFLKEFKQLIFPFFLAILVYGVFSHLVWVFHTSKRIFFSYWETKIWQSTSNGKETLKK